MKIVSVTKGYSVEKRAAIVEYLRVWEHCRAFLDCPMCGKKCHSIGYGAVIMRRSLRGMTIKCKYCDFQFTFTYRNFRKAIERFASYDKLSPSDNDAGLRLLAMFRDNDILEHRGKVAILNNQDRETL